MKKYSALISVIIALASTTSHALEFSLYAESTFTSGSDEEHNFSLGKLDFVAQHNLSDKTYAIVNYIFETEKDEVAVEVERLSINRTLTDWLEVGAGRYMQPLGYWNQNYAHGSLAQDTVSSPFAVDIEHQYKGFLPSHIDGLMFKGESGSFSYWLGGGNTDSIETAPVVLGSGPAIVTPSGTEAPGKAISSMGRITYHLTESVDIGAMLGTHNYTEASETGPGTTLVDYGKVLFKEQYASVNFSYIGKSFYTFGEFYGMNFSDNQSMMTTPIPPNKDNYTATVYYVQAGYRITDKFTIAARYEALDFKKEEATLFAVQEIVPKSETVVALKYMLEDSNAIKLEAKQINPEVGDTENIYALQWFFFVL